MVYETIGNYALTGAAAVAGGAAGVFTGSIAGTATGVITHLLGRDSWELGELYFPIAGAAAGAVIGFGVAGHMTYNHLTHKTEKIVIVDTRGNTNVGEHKTLDAYVYEKDGQKNHVLELDGKKYMFNISPDGKPGISQYLPNNKGGN